MNPENPDKGSLFVVATPIGNLADITLRAREILETVKVILCEDTQRTRKLLASLNVDFSDKRLVSFYDHNEKAKSNQIIEWIHSGLDIALVSDAGTPLVADPGFTLIRQAFSSGVAPSPIPGPSSLTAAVSVCPVSMTSFRFIGFLPRKDKDRLKQLRDIKHSTLPTVLFEPPHDFLKTLNEMVELGMAERKVFVAREVTKKFEEYLFDSVENLFVEFNERDLVQGELVLIVEGGELAPSYSIQQLMDAFKEEGLQASTASKLIAKLTGADRQEVYTEYVNRD